MTKRTGRHPREALRSEKMVERLKTPGFYPDGNCLYLRIDPNGARRWVLRLVVNGARRNMGLGSTSLVSLNEARELARKYRKMARAGIDPITERKAEHRRLAPAVTFAEAARQLFENKKEGWRNARHREQWWQSIEAYAIPKLGKMPVNMIGTNEVLGAIEPIWTLKPETASRTRQRIEAVLDYATAKELRQGDNPARWRGHLDHLLAKPSQVRRVKHHPAMRWQDLPAFMVELSKRNSRSAKALAFGILTAARSGEVRGLTWGEIDLKDGLWTVPAGRMKASKEHRVPLTAQALELLGEPGKPEASVFGGPGMGRPLSLLQRMGYDDLTVHGFRSTFRDWAGETTNYPREVIEAALAHRLKDKSEAAYARGDLFMKRRALMQDWANYAMGSKGTVTVLRQPAAMHALGGG